MRVEERAVGDPLSILVVDNDPDSADSLALLLEHWNHRVYVVYDGTQAIEVYRRQHPDVVLLDIGLPDIDGYDVARRMKQEDHSAVLVAVTGYGEEGDRRASAEAGFDRHFVKPIDLRDLRELLAGVYRRA
jgi:CheY-like chemotaxis protein